MRNLPARGMVRLLCLLMAVGVLASLGRAEQGIRLTRAMQRDPALGREYLSVADQVLVSFRRPTSPQDAQLLGERIGCRIAGPVPPVNGYLFDVPAGGTVPEALTWFRQQPEVRFAQLNYIYTLQQFTPNDPFYAQQYHHPLINSPLAWQYIGNMTGNNPTAPVVGDPGIIIGIVDSGVQTIQPDLASLIWINQNEIAGNGVDDDGNGFIDDVNGWDFSTPDNDPNPTTDNHGTVVAGLAAAVGNNALGVAGVSWQCKIMAIKIFPDNAALGTTSAIALQGIQYAIDNGADVINLSFGGPGTDPATEAVLVSGFTAVHDRGAGLPQRVGVVQVAAAGNSMMRIDQPDMYGPIQDEQNDEVIGVAALDQQDVLASFSNYGPLGIDISTYGVNMVSTLIDDPTITTDVPFGNGGQGTSFASPLVAGAAATIRAINPDLSAEAVRDILYMAAENMSSQLYSKNPSLEPQRELGHGPLDVGGAVLITQQAPPSVSLDFPSTGERIYNTTPVIRVTVRKAYAGAPTITAIRVAIGPQEQGQTTWRPDIYFRGTTLNSKTVEFQVGDPQAGDDMTGTGYEDEQAQGRASNLPLVVSDAGSTTYAVRITVSQEGTEDHESITSFRVSSSAFDAGLHMMSVPYDLGALGLGANLAYDSVFMRPDIVLGVNVSSPGGSFVARYDNATREYVRTDVAATAGELTSLDIGKGYWARLVVPVPRLTIRGQQARGIVSLGAPEGTPLVPGWHQIGVPFPYSIPVTALAVNQGGILLPLLDAVEQGYLRGAFYGYNASAAQYESQVLPNGVLEPFKGYWVRILQPTILVAQPVRVSGLGSVTVQGLPEGGWAARLVASVEGVEDRANSFGAAPGATVGFDLPYDQEEPPPIDGRVVLSFRPVDGEVFSRDIRGPVTDREVWRCDVRCALARQEVSLKWDDLRQVPRDLALFLRDEETGRIVSMRTLSGYTFVSGEAGSVRRFSVIAERRDGSGRLFNVEVLPVEMTRQAGATVSFRLSQTATVECVIRNVAGRIVRRVVTGKTCAAGVTTLAWDGRSEGGSLVPPGRYIVEVVATSERGERATGIRSVVKP